MIAIKELIEKFNNANTRKRDKQKIKNELVRRGGVVFEEIR
jgi:SOS response regulatory protein OraA/RecX